MKCKLDEHLPVELADSLAEAGFDAVTVVAQGLGGSPDVDLVSACRAEGRALVTLDTGFADIRSYRPDTCPGIIVLRLGRQDKRHILAVATELPALLKTEPVDKHLWIVEEHRVRIRG